MAMVNNSARPKKSSAVELFGRWKVFYLATGYTAEQGVPFETGLRVLYNSRPCHPFAGDSDRVSPLAEHSSDTDPLEFFLLGRRIRQGLSKCSQAAESRLGGDVFYLWLQTEPVEDGSTLTADQWLNIVDEAASLGVNWLVVTVGSLSGTRSDVAELCRWAHDTHGMVVCLHARAGQISDEERQMLLELPAASTFLLTDPEGEGAFSDLAAADVRVCSANPAPSGTDGETCDYPHRMIFVDSRGRLYTCGMVSGEHEFFLGSVLHGSLDTIIHNPQLPHSVSSSNPGDHSRCSGCPPLVAKHLCQK